MMCFQRIFSDYQCTYKTGIPRDYSSYQSASTSATSRGCVDSCISARQFLFMSSVGRADNFNGVQYGSDGSCNCFVDMDGTETFESCLLKRQGERVYHIFKSRHGLLRISEMVNVNVQICGSPLISP